jgi:hypothetical protein
MVRITAVLGTCGLLALGACATTPQGPTVMAMPGQGKTFDAFQQDDAYCGQAAFVSVGGQTTDQAAAAGAVGSAAAGTAIGAAAGALIGSATAQAGAGAAIGAGVGLLAGSAIGGSNAQLSAAQVQGRYDMTYAQCMFAQGNTVSQPGYGYAAAPAFWGAPAPAVVVGGPVWVGGGWYRGGWYGGRYWR